jgi:MerR family transcriptional regulator/heat shock protein HspR
MQNERVERGRYTISVAAELVNVHQQTLRHYERLGLIEPQRGRGEIRYFSPRDIERAQQIRRLIDELGVNLAGVDVILNMREQLEALQTEMQETVRSLREEHDAEVRRLKEIIKRLQSAGTDDGD